MVAGHGSIRTVTAAPPGSSGSLSRRGLLRLALAGAATALPVAVSGCDGPLRLDTSRSVRLAPPPPSTAEIARKQVAAGSRVLVAVLGALDPAALPPDTAARLPGWIEVSRQQLALLGDSGTRPDLLRGTPRAAAPIDTAAVPPSLRPRDPVRAAADLTQVLGDIAVAAAASSPAAGIVHARIAAARWAQDSLMRAALALPQREVLWPEASPLDLLQALLAAEHAAVDAGTTAAAWARAQRDTVLGLRREHEASRDRLVAAVVAAKGVPVPAEPGYGLPPEVLPGAPAAADPDQRALTLALAVESGVGRAAVTALGAYLAAPPPDSPVVGVAGAAVALLSRTEVSRQRLAAAPAPLPGD